MFTGIVHGISIVLSILKKKNFLTLKTQFPVCLIKNLKVGASISNNGCCLTVSKIKNCNVYFDIIEETLKKTNFSLLKIGSQINIERSLKYGDEIGGHFILGHIIGTAKILNIMNSDNNKKIFFQVNDSKIMKYIFFKGFISIDGISLTIGNVLKNGFYISFIPETIMSTNIKLKNIGDIVNIEIDYYTQIIIDKLESYININTLKK
ncbi:riboflavin synthase subunit alpha [Buchnera aphidicola]|uniref:Riboflavin synthase n=1 Tax=Buchnera aphidicola (Therioaphis trifolii) TaxID=1241884 RepID=A0A4D6YDI7_9GAMM|nr:riboflavin synthase subunit alpha [Buchnera aphidicola]QCI27092.1 riboflavin synthase subunit alpha [Buchnera aphidicola (Therioaphis trifolii)]